MRSRGLNVGRLNCRFFAPVLFESNLVDGVVGEGEIVRHNVARRVDPWRRKKGGGVS